MQQGFELLAQGLQPRLELVRRGLRANRVLQGGRAVLQCGRSDLAGHALGGVGQPLRFGPVLVLQGGRQAFERAAFALGKTAQQVTVQVRLAHGAAQADLAVHPRQLRGPAGLRDVERRRGGFGRHRRGAGGAGWLALRQPAQQFAPHRLGLDRLGQVRVHAGGAAALHVIRSGVGGHGQHRQVAQLRQLAQGQGGAQSVHHRHLHVHQHQVVALVAELVERDLAVLCQVHQQARLVQQFARHLLVQRVVFHQQHARAAHPGQLGRELGVRRPGQVGSPVCVRVGTQRQHDAVEKGRRAGRRRA